MARQNHFPKTVGVRLSPEDGSKLAHLCTATRRPPSEVLRLLVRQAQTPEVPTFTFTTATDQSPDAQKPQGCP